MIFYFKKPHAIIDQVSKIGFTYFFIMKTVEELNNSKIPIVRIDPSLEKYRSKILCPEKLAKANEMLKQPNYPTQSIVVSSVRFLVGMRRRCYLFVVLISNIQMPHSGYP